MEGNNPIVYKYDKAATGYDRFSGCNYELLRTVLEYINANLTVKMSADFGFIDEQGVSHGMNRDVLSSTIDVIMSKFFLRDYWKVQAYPFNTGALTIISAKFSANYADKFLLIFNVKELVFLFVGCLVVIVSLNCMLQQSISETILEFLRAFIGTSTVTEPKTFWRKLFFISLLFIVFIINTYIQSDLHAFSIVPNQIPTIDSIDDLLNSDFKIYGDLFSREIISNEQLRERYRALTFSECIDRLLANGHIACIYVRPFAQLYIYENQTVHISKNDIVERYYTYTFAEDSPLLHKINLIISLMAEGGLMKLFQDHAKYHFLRSRDDREIEKGLGVDDLIVVFGILTAGSMLACFALLVEIAFKKIRKIHSRKFKVK